MMWIRALLVLVVTASAVHASVTVGWKMPVEKVVPSFADTPPLAKPPGDSAFFQPGDQLWDLSKSLDWRVQAHAEDHGEIDPFAEPEPVEAMVDWKGDWIVWNSRSGMIVARGSWHDVLVAEQVLGCDELPKVIRNRLDVKGRGKPRSLSLVSCSGEKASLEMNDLKAEVEAISSKGGNVIDSMFRLNWPAEDNRGTWGVKTAVTLQPGKSCRIACQGTEDQRWELVVSSEEELLDGTPVNEFRWVETAGGLRALANGGGQGKPQRKQLDADRWLRIQPIMPGFASYLLDKACERASADLTLPAELAEWDRNPLIDLRMILADQGITFREEGHLAGFDPLTSMAFIVADRVNHDILDVFFANILDGEVEPPIWIETNPESGGWGLACRSGEAAEIRRDSGNLAESLLFRSEPTQGGDGLAYDLRYSLDVVAGDAKIGKLEAATTLTKDKPQVVGSGTTPDGKEVKVIVTASRPAALE